MSIKTVLFRAGWLSLFLFSFYLLLFSGRFHSIDEVSSVALADSLWMQGEPTTNQIGWSQSWSLPQGTYGLDGQLYSKKGMGYSLLLLPFQWLVRQVEGVGVVGMAHLANALITALTGGVFYCLVWAVASSVGLQVNKAGSVLIVVLAWGIGTFAVVYSKYLFNSPIVTLCFVVGAALLWLANYSFITTRKFSPWLLLFLSGVALGFSLLARAENALVVPVFALYLWFTPYPYRTRFMRLVAFGLPIGLTVLYLFYLNWFRFGDILNFGYDLSQEANGNILVGLAGFVFSPGRSMVLMMPLLIPAVWGWVRLARQNPEVRRLAWLVLGLTIVYALFFARSADWWGGWNWGIRYFLPLLPLWVMGLLGVMEYALQPREHPIAGTLIWTTILLSVGIQALGVLVDFNRPLLADAANNISLDAQLWGWERAQIVSHLAHITEWQRWDLLSTAVQDWQIAWQPFAVILLATVGLLNAHLPSPNPFYQYSLPLLAFVLMQWSAVTMQQRAVQDPVWAPYHADLTALNTQLADTPPDSLLLFEMLLYRPYFDRAQAWLNLGTSDLPYLELIQENEPSEEQERLREVAVARARQVYVAVEGTAIGDPNSATERWMSQRAHYAGTEWVSDNTRLTTFYASNPLSVVLENENLSDNLSLHEGKIPTTLAAGNPLLVELVWGATATPAQDYTVFVQLLRPDGTVALQQDSAPQAGFARTSQWQAGAEVVDRRALLLPADLPAGDYTLITGMYDANGTRLRVATGGDFITVGMVTVTTNQP